MASTFREIIEFFDKIGIYDVILPFLLVFTIVFAILEKSKVLGTEEIDDRKYTKKNLNSMVAFVIAFLVVASSELVRTINEAMANMVLLLLLSISFLLLVGSFHKSDEEFYLQSPYKEIFMGIMFLGILGIFLYAIEYKNEPFLEYAFDYVVDRFDTNAVGSIVLIIVLVGFMFYITQDPRSSSGSNKSNEDDKKS